jgi:hypothetical protein
MLDTITSWLLRVLRVPPEPEPPLGGPGSLRVFRAARNFYRLRFYLWLLKQAFALAGIILWLSMIAQWRQWHLEAQRLPAAARANPTQVELPPARDPNTGNRTAPRQRRKQPSPMAVIQDLSMRTPTTVFVLLWAAEALSILAYLGQLPLTYAALRLDYEQRWYVVTDRSLRIRHGIWSVQEITMSFANLQHISVTQGPLERLLRIADLQVQSAGGGGGGGGAGSHGHQHAGGSLHTGFFRGVDNAEEVRDLILERLRRFRETGLGDPDEARDKYSSGPLDADGKTLQGAAVEVLTEARNLRQALSG